MSATTPTTEGRATTRAARAPATRVAVRLLVVSTVAIAAAYAGAFGAGAAPVWCAWVLVAAVPLALVGVMVLGAARAGRVSRALGVAFALVGLTLAGCFAAALALPAGAGAAEPLLLGLPRRAAVIVYGVGLLPVFVLPAAYALTFDAQTLRDEDLERVRAAAVSVASRGKTRAGRGGGR